MSGFPAPTEGLRRSQIQATDPIEVDMLSRDPQIVCILHRQPAFGRTADRLGQAKRHFRSEAAGALEDPAEGGSGHVQLPSQFAAADAVGFQVVQPENLEFVERPARRTGAAGGQPFVGAVSIFFGGAVVAPQRVPHDGSVRGRNIARRFECLLAKVGREADFGDTPLWTRVNSLDSPWFLDDAIRLVGEIGDRLEVIMVPKVEGPWDIHYVDRLLAQLEARHKLKRAILVHAILETALGVTNVEEICAASPRIQGINRKRDLDEIVERSLHRAALWDEVKDRLEDSALGLSGGQQQRLCIARAIAVEPEVILLDEPCSALDPIATARIEELMQDLKTQYTQVIVTHNMQQASRVSDETAFFSLGQHGAGFLVEMDSTTTIFTNPRERLTEDYVSGRFG